MKQCVAPVSSRAVTYRKPSSCAVQVNPNSSGLNFGLHCCPGHAWNSGMVVSATMLACQAAAKQSPGALVVDPVGVPLDSGSEEFAFRLGTESNLKQQLEPGPRRLPSDCHESFAPMRYRDLTRRPLASETSRSARRAATRTRRRRDELSLSVPGPLAGRLGCRDVVPIGLLTRQLSLPSS
jgi:hypothetical protein